MQVYWEVVMKKIIVFLSFILSVPVFCMEKMEIEPSGEMEVKKDVLVLPVPKAEEPREPRSIDLNEVYEPLELHEPFKTVIEELKKEGKELFLAETVSGDESNPDYRYYDAAPESIFVEFLKRHPDTNDFVSGKPIERIYFYIYNPETEEIKFHKVFDHPFNEEKWKRLYSEIIRSPLENLLQELSPDAHADRYDAEKEELDLDNLDLYDENIPADFFPRLAHILPNLKVLNLYQNHLKTLPDNITHLINLTVLSLWVNELTSLPDNIGALVNLESLTISINQLESLPESISDLINLKSLVVNTNELKSLPDRIGDCINLEDLQLSYNSLESLPESIGDLVNLEYFELIENQLQALPDSIGNLGNLKKLDVRNNPELIISAELLRKLRNRGVIVHR